mmetsp:Transcript_37091/g.112133  ORF Transcript_37091/g.112133 Transcript_37091/m.112133 type:complete len:202 (-) Transcript_37091:1225-1830(-)
MLWNAWTACVSKPIGTLVSASFSPALLCTSMTSAPESPNAKGSHVMDRWPRHSQGDFKPVKSASSAKESSMSPISSTSTSSSSFPFTVLRARLLILPCTAFLAIFTSSAATCIFSACLMTFCKHLRLVLSSPRLFPSRAATCSRNLNTSQSSFAKFWYNSWASFMTSCSLTPCLMASLRATSNRSKSQTSMAPMHSRRILP